MASIRGFAGTTGVSFQPPISLADSSSDPPGALGWMAADGVWTHQGTAPRRVVVVGGDLIFQRRLAFETKGAE